MSILTTGDTGFPGLDIKYILRGSNICCQMSPDGLKVAITEKCQTCILEIAPGSGMDITDPIEVVKNVYNLVWFPDSNRIAYLRGWKGENKGWDGSWDLIVQRPWCRQCTTIHRSGGHSTDYTIPRVFVTADGSRLITQDEESFMTWDVSEL